MKSKLLPAALLAIAAIAVADLIRSASGPLVARFGGSAASVAGGPVTPDVHGATAVAVPGPAEDPYSAAARPPGPVQVVAPQPASEGVAPPAAREAAITPAATVADVSVVKPPKAAVAAIDARSDAVDGSAPPTAIKVMATSAN